MTPATQDQAGLPPERDPRASDQERSDVLDILRSRRDFLRFTVQGLSDEQAATRTTVSELCLGGLVKHVAAIEQRWATFMLQGPEAFGRMDEAAMAEHAATFRMAEGETLEGLLARYQEIGERTDELVRSLPSLDDSQPLPDAPWFPPDTHWSARRVLLHIIAETAQHAGHADLLREAIDGQKTMG